MPSCRHVAFYGIRLRDVDDGGEEVGFAVLAAERLLREEERRSAGNDYLCE